MPPDPPLDGTLTRNTSRVAANHRRRELGRAKMSRANGRRDADILLAIALASGATLTDAAAQVGISLSTAKRRAADSAFIELAGPVREDCPSRKKG
jgi:hypothetical protein